MSVLHSSSVGRGASSARLVGVRPGGGAGSGCELEVGVLEGADGEADLADVLAAAATAVEVLLELVFEVGWEHAIEVVGDELDELLAGEFVWLRREVPGP